ncbi:MAG: fatty acid desaturase [Gemmatales bacterium]
MQRNDERLRQVAWRDLVDLRWWECLWELSLPIPWLVFSLVGYGLELWPLAVLGSFFFFLTGLRLSHNAQHHALGIGRLGHDLVLAVLSILMLASMHAVRVTHLQHHKHCLDDDDVEAGHVHLPWWQAMLYGPVFIYRLHTNAWRLGSRSSRRWILLELVWVGIVLGVAFIQETVRWHVLAMLTGECMTAFFAVWIVHHGCDAHNQIARTQRGWLKNIVSYSMFYHLEHHLFPAVPTCHLDRLSQRLDVQCPEAREMEVI